ncbi:MAG: repeat protein, partial [Rhizobacter sp.]|nr:repeat protein [Rhizobacter sp.]
DTLRLAGTQMSLDLTHITDLALRLQSIEKVDLGDATAHNSLTLDAASVLALGASGVFNDTTFAGGLGAVVGRTQLVIDGGAASVLHLDGAWVESNVTLSRAGATYAVYDSADTLAQLIVNTDLTRDLG